MFDVSIRRLLFYDGWLVDMSIRPRALISVGAMMDKAVTWASGSQWHHASDVRRTPPSTAATLSSQKASLEPFEAYRQLVANVSPDGPVSVSLVICNWFVCKLSQMITFSIKKIVLCPQYVRDLHETNTTEFTVLPLVK